MDKEFPLIESYEVASDVCDRDGIGIEIYEGEELVLEIFRDDTKLSRDITLYKKEASLDFMEQSIGLFKKEIPWEFIPYDE